MWFSKPENDVPEISPAPEPESVVVADVESEEEAMLAKAARDAEFVAEWENIAISTSQHTDAEIYSAVDDVYAQRNLKPPIWIEIVDSPEKVDLENNHKSFAGGSFEVVFELESDDDFRRSVSHQRIKRNYDYSGTPPIFRPHAIIYGSHFVPVEFYPGDGTTREINRAIECSRSQLLPYIAGRDYTSSELAGEFKRLMRMACVYLFSSQKAIVCRNPTSIMIDSNEQLSNETGPAVTYADGTKYFYIRGIDIPGEWIDGDFPPVADILQIENTDKRTLALELIGWDKALEHVDSRIIDQHSNPQMGSLLLVNLPNSGPELFIKAQCGTGRTIALCVTDSRARTVQQAQNWIWSLDGTSMNYNPEMRT